MFEKQMFNAVSKTLDLLNDKIKAIDAEMNGAPVAPVEKPLEGMAKFLTVKDGVTLVRFNGKDTIHLAARRKGTNGNPNAIFTIDISKVTKSATVKKDGKTLFAIDGPGCNYSRLEKIAVAALHRWFKDTRPSNSKRRRAKRLAAEATVKEVK